MFHLSSRAVISFPALFINIHAISTPVIIKNSFSLPLGRQIEACPLVSWFGCVNKPFPCSIPDVSVTSFAARWADKLGFCSKFMVESLNFIRQKILSAIFLKVTGSLNSFLRNYLPNIQVWIKYVYQSLVSSKNSVPWCKWLVLLRTQTTWGLLHCALVCRSVFSLYCPLCLKNTCGQRLIFNKTNISFIFSCFIKDIRKWNWHSILSLLSLAAKPSTTSTVGYGCLNLH